MASASKTPNLNLPQWVGTEKPERTDFNAAFDAIDDHVAESANKHIKESGSNANGRYIKFDDGTQICIINSVVLNKASNYYLQAIVSLPAQFNTADYSVSMLCTEEIATPVGRETVKSKTVSGLALTYFNIDAPFTDASYAITFNVIAIGR